MPETLTAATAADPVPLPLRHDTFFGVCQAIGDDFGFSPNWLRVLIGATVLYSPLVAIGGYLALGLVVALSRFVAPNKRPAPAPQLVAEAAPAAARPTDAEQVALAA